MRYFIRNMHKVLENSIRQVFLLTLCTYLTGYTEGKMTRYPQVDAPPSPCYARSGQPLAENYQEEIQKMSISIGIVGTGICGQAVMMRLNMVPLPNIDWRLFAKDRSVGRQFSIKGKRCVVQKLRPEDGARAFDGLTRVIVCAPPEVAYQVAHDCVFAEDAMRRSIIDCSSAFADWDEALDVGHLDIYPQYLNQHAGVIVPHRRSLHLLAGDVASILQHVVSH